MDVSISLRSTEGTDDQPFLLWDTVWDNVNKVYDWKPCAFGDPLEPQNGGGLQSRHPLDTAILIQLGTDRRAEPGDELPPGGDPKGWWGDSIKLDDDIDKLGSRFWQLRRAVLNEATGRKAVQFGYEAVTVFLVQGVVARFNITVDMNKTAGWLILNIDGFSQDGSKVYSQRFAPIWALEAAAAQQQHILLF